MKRVFSRKERFSGDSLLQANYRQQTQIKNTNQKHKSKTQIKKPIVKIKVTNKI